MLVMMIKWTLLSVCSVLVILLSTSIVFSFTYYREINRLFIFHDNGGGNDHDAQLGTKIMADFVENDDLRLGTRGKNHNKDLPIEEASSLCDSDLFSELLTTINCIPSVCSTPKQFITEPQLLADKQGFMILGSFPGSGNTWGRMIVEEGTRLWTGSRYYDAELFKDGFEGETVTDLNAVFPTVAVVKSHAPYFDVDAERPWNKNLSAAVIILRSPFDAFVAEINRVIISLRARNQTTPEENDHTTSATQAELQLQFLSLYSSMPKSWLRFASYWLNEEYWDPQSGARYNSTNTTICNKNGVTTIQFQEPATARPGPPHPASLPVMAMFYEDFENNFVESSIRLFTFLKSRLGKAMPDVKDAVICALLGLQAHSREQRQHSETESNPYHEPTLRVTQQIIDDFCILIKPYWFEAKWGNCNLAARQRLRQ